MNQDARQGQRVAFVTGAGRGIGLACTRKLQADGYIVAGGYRNSSPDFETLQLDPDLNCTEADELIPSAPDRLQSPMALSPVFPVECDVTSTASVEDAFALIEGNLGPVEILVANAGITDDQISVRMTDDQWDRVIEANLTGSFRVARRAATKMLRNRKGRIIFISSIAGSMGQVGQANYSASKAGLVGLARSMARELASRSITVNVVAPGAVRTGMLEALGDKAIDTFASMIPMGRIASPEEIAGAVSFLASEGASYVTGTVLAVDGGLGMGL